MTKRGARGVDVDSGNIIAATVGHDGYGREGAVRELVRDGDRTGRGGARGAGDAHVHGRDHDEICGVGLYAAADDVECVMMRHGQEGGRNRRGNEPASWINVYVPSRKGGAVEADLCAGGEAGAEDLYAREIARGSQRPLGKQGLGYAANNSGTGTRAGNDDLRDLRFLQRVGSART